MTRVFVMPRVSLVPRMTAVRRMRTMPRVGVVRMVVMPFSFQLSTFNFQPSTADG
jgi:hypothetical protein